MNVVRYRPARRGNWGFPTVLNDFFGKDLDTFFGSDFATNIPSVNLKETNNSFELELAVPGTTKDDIQVNVDNGMIEITGTKKEEQKEEKDQYLRREYNYSSFIRRFRIPEHTAIDKISAKHENGILLISIPKSVEITKSQKSIEIK